MKTFVDRLLDEIVEKKSILCFGIDPQVKYIPPTILQQGYEEPPGTENKFEAAARAIIIYFEKIIPKVAPFVAIAKPQGAFYGPVYKQWGGWALEKIVKICRENSLLVVLDHKCSDGGDTAEAYAAGYIGEVDVWDPIGHGPSKQSSFDFDAVTVTPSIGESCLTPFIKIVKEKGKGIFVVTKTSFKPNSAIEQLVCQSGRKVWEEIAIMVREWSKGCEGENGINNVGVVSGATFPEDSDRMRELIPNCFQLKPGFGAQGAGPDEAVRGGPWIIVSSSRDIDFPQIKLPELNLTPEKIPEAAAQKAESSRDLLNEATKRTGKTLW